MAKNFRNTREFREAMLEALGTTQDKDVENEANFKSALLEALGVEHTRSDVVNFETFREKLVEGITNKSDGGGGGGSSDFYTAVYNDTGATANITYYEDEADDGTDMEIDNDGGIIFATKNQSTISFSGIGIKGRDATGSAFTIDAILPQATIIGSGVLVLYEQNI